MEYKFKINEFEGPLDLLLHLIKESEMDIMDIEIVKLTDQYLNYINDMEKLNLSIASEYLVLASDLMYLKSKTLLPKQEEQEEEEEYIETKENLINKLLEYKRYKEVTNDFKFLEEERSNIYTKTPSNMKPYQSTSITLNNDITLDDLVKAFQKYLERKKYEEPLTTKVTTKEISIEERRKSIKNILTLRKKVEFFELFEQFSKPYLVATFLSILEMAKEKEIIITQENNFDKIYCEVS
ncbi:MAG: segregation and condensation protein A [Bacilli bacterium]